MKKIYLGKNGKSFEFSQSEYERMQEAGKDKEYTFIWSDEESIWKTIELPPPPPVEVIHRPSETQIALPPSPPALKLVKGLKPVEALCVQKDSAVSGKLAQVTREGCRLQSNGWQQAPHLTGEQAVLLNLLDPKTGNSMNVEAKISQIRRNPEGWSYDLQWQEFPRILTG